jgi:hypothetical protein
MRHDYHYFAYLQNGNLYHVKVNPQGTNLVLQLQDIIEQPIMK